MPIYNVYYMPKKENEHSKELLERIMSSLEENNGVIYGTEPAGEYGYYLNTVNYRGRVIDVSSKYNSIAEREYTEAICIEYDENGNVKYVKKAVEYAVSDASEEDKAAYKAYLAYNARKKRILEKREARKKIAEDARTILNVPMWDAIFLKERIGNTNYQNILKLMKSYRANRLRSEFRKSLATQVDNWLKGDRKYKVPLSPKQMSYLGDYITF